MSTFGLHRWPRGLVVAASATIALLRWPWSNLGSGVVDPWRRTLGLGLRSEGTRFGLASFGLNPGPDPTQVSFTQRWRAFLETEPDAHWALQHNPHLAERVPLEAIDVVAARFETDGSLISVRAELDPRFPVGLPEPDARAVEAALINAYAATRQESDLTRPRQLQKLVTNLLAHANATSPLPTREAYAARLIQAAFLSFASPPGSGLARFQPPDFRLRRDFGASLLNAVARLNDAEGTADLWLSIHHTGADGAPMQELLSRLEATWGINTPIAWPAPDDTAAPAIMALQSSPADRPIHLLIDRFDFTPLIRWRSAANRRWGERLGEPIPLPAVLIWHLARQPAFAGRTFSTAVDVPARPGELRAVDLVAVRPADYADRTEPFVAYACDYLALVARARRRASPGWRAMRALALLPPALAARALSVNPKGTRATFGTVGISVLKDASVFTAPMADAGWDDGFLALGNLALPTDRGGKVGFFTAKGTAMQLAGYPAAVRQALADCSRLPD